MNNGLPPYILSNYPNIDNIINSNSNFNRDKSFTELKSLFYQEFNSELNPDKKVICKKGDVQEKFALLESSSPNKNDPN